MKKIVICILFAICLITVFYLIQNENQLFETKKQKLKLSQISFINKPIKFYEFQTKMEDGVPIIQIKINNNFFKCIFDTGSSQINLSHKDCKKCNLLDGAYKEKIKNNEQFIIEYGSQIDTVVEEKAKLILNKPIEVNVFLTINRKAGLSGDSNHNVFGAMIPYSKHLKFLKSNYIYCNFHNNKHKKIILCNKEFVQPLFKNSNFVSIKYKPHSYSMPFYIVPIYKIEVNGKQSYFNINQCVIDTGSNQTTFPEAIGKKIMDALQRSRFQCSLNIYFNKHSFITLRPSDLFWNQSSFLMIDNDISALNHRQQNNSMILGCYNIRNRNFIFGTNYFHIEDK